MVAHLNFVDLAGSEKAGENSGDRLREGCSINKSLLILGQVISKLSDGVSNQHISYRDSKLTRILQASLGGNSKTAIIATITPASLEESHSTLRFASQAKKIKNKAMANEVLSEAAMLKKLQKEIKHQQQLNELGKIENQDLKKSLEQMELRMKFIIQSGPTQSQAKRKRRETWCPGKKKSIFKPTVSFSTDDDIFLSEMPLIEDLPEPNENESVDKMPTITTRGKRSFEQTKMKASISPDAKTKKLMDLEDKYEILLKEHALLKTEFNDMSTFHNLERKSLEENIAELHDEKNTILKECTKLSDEVIQKEHKLKIQTRKMTEFQSELEINRRAKSLDASTPTIQEECEQLKATIRQLEEEKASSKTDSVNSTDVICKLQEECTILQKQVEELGTEKSELIEQVDTEQNKMATLTKDYEVLKSTAKDLVEERLKVQDTLTCFGLEVENLPILKEKFEELMQEKENLVMELNSLKEEKETPETSNDELQNLKETTNDLKQKLKDMEEEKTVLLMKLETLQSENREIPTENRMTEMEEECRKLRETVQELEERKMEATDSTDVVNELMEECSTLKLQIEKLEAERTKGGIGEEIESQKVAMLEEECEILRATVKDLADERLNMQDELTDVGSKIEQLPILKEKVEELMQEKETLAIELNSLKEEKETPETSNDELQNLKETTNDLQKKLKDMEEEKTVLLAKLETLQSENREIPTENRMTEMEEECRKLRETVQELEERKMEATDSTDVVNELMKECSTLKLQIEKLEAERTCAVEGADTESQKVATLEEECEILRATVKDLADERLNMQDELTDVGSKIEQLPILKEKVEELMQEKETLAIELNSLKEEKETPETSNDELQNLKETTNDLQQKLKDMEEEKTVLLMKLETLQSENREIPTENRMTEMEEECRKLRETVQELEERKMEATDSTDVVNELMEECSTLKLQIEKLEAERTKGGIGEEIESQKVAMLEEECEILRATVKDLADERLNMQDELTDVGSKIEQLPILKEKVEELMQEKETLAIELNSLKEEKETPETSNDELQNLKEMTNDLQQKLKDMEEEKTVLLMKLETLQSENREIPTENRMTEMEEECRKLRETVQELEERKMEATDSTDVVNELMEECSTLKLQIKKLEAERTCTDEGADTESQKVATLEEECEILRATVKDLADERLNMQDELTDVGSKIEQLPILKEKVEELMQEKETLAIELNSLKEEKETPETSNDELQNLKETTNDLQQKLKDMEEEKTVLLMKLETLQSENREIPTENRMTEMEEECKKLRETVQELEERKMEATDSTDVVNELMEECSTLKLQIEKLEAERTKGGIGEEIESQKVAMLEEECEVLRATVKDLADERLNMQDELTDVGSKIEQLPIVTEKCEKLEEINNQLLSEISTLKDTNISLKVQLGETSDSLNQELEDLKMEVQTKETLQQECDQLKTKVEALCNEQATLQDEITNLKPKAEQLPCLQEKCDELLREKESHLAEISQGNTNLEQQSLELGNLHEKISMLELKLEESENDSIQLKSELKDLEMERQTKTAAFEKFKSIYKSMEKEKTELNEKVQNLEKELAERLSEQNEESGRVCTLLEEMNEIQRNASEAEKERSELQMKLEEATDKLHLIREMEEEVLNSQEEARRLQQENSQLTDKIEIMKQTLEMQKSHISELSSVEKQKQECEETISVKNKELEQLKAEISTLKEEKSSIQSLSVMNSSAPWEEEKKQLYKLLHHDRTKYVQQTAELNRLKELTPLLLSKRDELEKKLEKGVDESELGQKLKLAESDADKYYELYNQTQERMEELESSLKENQADMETIKARVLQAETKAEELQKTNARYWEELGEKKMMIFARDTVIEKFEEKKQTLVRQYEETIEMKDDRIKKLKAEIRQRDADVTFSVQSPQKGENSSTSNNQMSVVDKFSAYMLEAKNLRLEREVKKLEKKVLKLEEHPIVKPCTCEVQEIQTKFEEMRAEKEKIQTEFNHLKKRYLMKHGGRDLPKEEQTPQTEELKTSLPKQRMNLRRPQTNQSKEQMSDNQCKQQ
ncbi:centromere-associated protein E-like isoform X2 [Argopecten irradians]|uniref:centromere-associated protein E-like isoform X2 n=1 Tax=Argopecten irradians TaxID=31199 RepID=UPI00371068F7